MVDTIESIDCISTLRTRTISSAPGVFVAGYYAKGDGGGGQYFLDPADCTTADNGGTVIVTTDGGRWKLARTSTLSVRQFGAKGDRVTDDRACIQAAIDCFGWHGGTVYFPTGEYAIGGAGLVMSDRVAGFNGAVLEGEGQGVVLVKIGTPNSILCIKGKRSTIRSLTFDGAGLAGCGIFMDTAFNGQPTLIENCAFQSFVNQGIFNDDGDSYMVRNCYFLGCGQYAIVSRNNFMNSTIAANYIQGSGGVRLGSASQQAEGVRIVDNTILCVGGIGVLIDWGLEITIANNVIDQVSHCGVRVKNNASYVKLIGNWIAGGVDGCVRLDDNASRITVQGNTFEGGAVSQLVANAQVVGNITGLVVQGNQHGNIAAGSYGMLILNTRRASITGNVTHGAGESMYWNTGTGVISSNCFHKAPVIDGTAVQAHNVIG